MIRTAIHPARSRSTRGGFTLIELILALALVAVVAVSLYASLHIAFHATEVTDKALEPSRTADLAMELIAGDLQNAISPNTTITNAQNITDLTMPAVAAAASTASSSSSSASSTATPTGWVLSGPLEGTQTQTGNTEADDLVLFTTSDGPTHTDGDGEIKMVELTIDTPQGTEQPCLVRKVTAALTSEVVQTPDEEILCRGVTGLTFQYFDGANWNPTWDSTSEDNQLPAAVQVTLNLQRSQSNGQMRTLTYTRVFLLTCSMAVQDTNVNTGTNGL